MCWMKKEDFFSDSPSNNDKIKVANCITRNKNNLLWLWDENKSQTVLASDTSFCVTKEGGLTGRRVDRIFSPNINIFKCTDGSASEDISNNQFTWLFPEFIVGWKSDAKACISRYAYSGKKTNQVGNPSMDDLFLAYDCMNQDTQDNSFKWVPQALMVAAASSPAPASVALCALAAAGAWFSARR